MEPPAWKVEERRRKRTVRPHVNFFTHSVNPKNGVNGGTYIGWSLLCGRVGNVFRWDLRGLTLMPMIPMMSYLLTPI